MLSSAVCVWSGQRKTSVLQSEDLWRPSYFFKERQTEWNIGDSFSYLKPMHVCRRLATAVEVVRKHWYAKYGRVGYFIAHHHDSTTLCEKGSLRQTGYKLSIIIGTCWWKNNENRCVSSDMHSLVVEVYVCNIPDLSYIYHIDIRYMIIGIFATRSNFMYK